MINHMYWCVVSTPNSDGDMMVAKWLSLETTFTIYTPDTANSFGSTHMEGLLDETKTRSGLRGVSDIHVQKYYSELMYVYAVTDSKASEKLSVLLKNPKLSKDIAKLSPAYQTSSLESFHSVVIHFAPKSTAFSYQGMQCR